MKSNEIYDMLTDKVIALLERGVVAWQKGWMDYGGPYNPVTGTRYSGINAENLWWDMLLNGWTDPRFLTFQQVQKLGGRVKAGSRGEYIIRFKSFYDEVEELDAKTGEKTGEKKEKFKGVFPYVLSYPTTVKGKKVTMPIKLFNIEQTTGVDLPALDKIEPSQTLRDIWENYPDKPFLRTVGVQPCYIPSEDTIEMPDPDLFFGQLEHSVTFAHEVIHSTGHEKRLNRKIKNRFGDELYSQEELVAEMGAMYLCSIAGIDVSSQVENSAAYIKGWLKRLKDDKRMVLHAAQQAKHAVEYIVPSLKQEKQEEEAA